MPSTAASALHESVFLFVCNAIFSGLARYFLLIFCMKLQFNEHIKVKDKFFEEISCSAVAGVNGPLLGFISTLNFSLSLFFPEFYLMTHSA